MASRGDMSEGERAFFLVCGEYSCKEAQLPPPWLLRASKRLSNFIIMNDERVSGQVEASAYESQSGTLQLIMHSNTLVLPSPPTPHMLQEVLDLNRFLSGCSVVIDVGCTNKLVLLSTLNFPRSVSNTATLKKLIWLSLRRMYGVWKERYPRMAGILRVKEDEPPPVPEPPAVSELGRGPQRTVAGLISADSVTSQEKMKEILTDHLNKLGFKSLNDKRAGDMITIYFAVLNNGATLSFESSSFPEVYTITRKTLNLQIIFSRSEAPYSIPKSKEKEDSYLRLISQVNSRLKIGRFQFAKATRQISFQHSIPYYRLSEAQIRAVLPSAISLSVDRFKLYSQSFSRLLHDLEKGLKITDMSSYTSYSEEMKPDYCDSQSSSRLPALKGKTTIFEMSLSSKDSAYKLEKDLFEKMCSNPELKEVLLHKSARFLDETKRIRCAFRGISSISAFLDLHWDNTEVIVQELLATVKALVSNGYHLASIDSVYVVQLDDGTLKVKILPWKLTERISGMTSICITNFVSTYYSKLEQILEQNQPAHKAAFTVSRIPTEELTFSQGFILYKGERVTLRRILNSETSERARNLKLFLVTLLRHCSLANFSHIHGWVEDLPPPYEGLHRVEAQLQPISTTLLAMPLAFRFRVLCEIGSALVSLHHSNLQHLCLTPSHISYERGNVQFLFCAITSHALSTLYFSKQDLWFFAPEVLRLLLTNSPDSHTEVEESGIFIDVHGFARLLYFYLVDTRRSDKEHDPVPNLEDHSPVTSDELEAHLNLHSSGVRPLISPEFEEDYPMLTSCMREAWEEGLRPSLLQLLSALKEEARHSLDLDTSGFEL